MKINTRLTSSTIFMTYLIVVEEGTFSRIRLAVDVTLFDLQIVFSLKTIVAYKLFLNTALAP